ncbi:DsbA family oxidoreductase [Tomitella cavernea]|uniref:DsbA family oxidoreductase n=1 Tax=Tomitella cavernea TaxID=1387982 RepID=A0ABP9C6B0_9ACTN|nr:DsbA family oxidoreductase [Tomitella cavernea]
MTSAQTDHTTPVADDRFVELEVWTDVACPWCYIGATRLTAALDAFDRGDRVRVTWRAYELAPDREARAGRREVDALVESKGMSAEQVQHMFGQVSQVAAGDGLHLDFDRTIAANTFDAHRLVHLAGAGTVQGGRVLRALYRAHFTDGVAVDDVDALVAIAEAQGLDAEAVRTGLTDPDSAAAVSVREDELLAARFGITGVPFFIADRKYAVSGAQPVDVITELLRTAFDGTEDD